MDLRSKGALLIVGQAEIFSIASALPTGYAAGKTFTALWDGSTVAAGVVGDEITVAVTSVMTGDLGLHRLQLRQVGGNKLWSLDIIVSDSPGTPTDDLEFTIVSGEISIDLAVIGSPGVGVAPGGATGQALVKTSGTDYATAWADLQSTSAKGQAGGYPSLDGSGLIPDAQIPSGVTRDSELASSVAAAVSALVAGAPGALDTLNELAAAVNDDASFAATVTSALGARPTLTAADARYAPITIDGGTP